jgi:hypothetical protein
MSGERLENDVAEVRRGGKRQGARAVSQFRKVVLTYNLISLQFQPEYLLEFLESLGIRYYVFTLGICWVLCKYLQNTQKYTSLVFPVFLLCLHDRLCLEFVWFYQ